MNLTTRGDPEDAGLVLHEIFDAIVLGGMRAASGMPSFADVLDVKESELIRQYVISRAQVDREEALAEGS